MSGQLGENLSVKHLLGGEVESDDPRAQHKLGRVPTIA